jgi:hypothetical protein
MDLEPLQSSARHRARGLLLVLGAPDSNKFTTLRYFKFATHTKTRGTHGINIKTCRNHIGSHDCGRELTLIAPSTKGHRRLAPSGARLRPL